MAYQEVTTTGYGTRVAQGLKTPKMSYHLVFTGSPGTGKMTPDAAKYMKEFLDYAVAHKDRNFGNARFARNVFEKTIQSQANRLSKEKNVTAEQLQTLTLDDVQWKN